MKSEIRNPKREIAAHRQGTSRSPESLRGSAPHPGASIHLHCLALLPQAQWSGSSALAALFLAAVLLSGCKQSRVEQALDSDANGYLCGACQAKFYTERKVFADVCPKCKSPQLVQAMGYICTADGHVTVAGRGRSSVPCEKCGQPASGLSIPREADLRAWGAAKKTQREVSGGG